jgi:hypothetical protein
LSGHNKHGQQHVDDELFIGFVCSPMGHGSIIADLDDGDGWTAMIGIVRPVVVVIVVVVFGIVVFPERDPAVRRVDLLALRRNFGIRANRCDGL